MRVMRVISLNCEAEVNSSNGIFDLSFDCWSVLLWFWRYWRLLKPYKTWTYEMEAWSTVYTAIYYFLVFPTALITVLKHCLDCTFEGSVYVTSSVSFRMSVLMRAGRAEPNAVWSVMSLVICWQAITAGWLSGFYHYVINTDQCTCLSSNTISLHTALLSSLRELSNTRK